MLNGYYPLKPSLRCVGFFGSCSAVIRTGRKMRLKLTHKLLTCLPEVVFNFDRRRASATIDSHEEQIPERSCFNSSCFGRNRLPHSFNSPACAALGFRADVRSATWH